MKVALQPGPAIAAVTPPAARARRCAGTVLLACAWPMLAQADCVDGVRKPSASESDFHQRATAALIAALPPAPQGVRVTGVVADIKRAPNIGMLCKDQKSGDFKVEASRFYVLDLSEEESNRRRAQRTVITNQLYELAQMPPEQKARRNALQQQADAGFTATDAARKNRDEATAKARESEAKAFSQQARDMQKAHDDAVRPQTDELTKRRDAIPLAGQEAAVRLHINLAKLPAVSSTVPHGIYGAASPGLSASFKVQNLTWSVGGSDTPLRQALADALDKSRLQGLVGKSPPGVEESEAFALKLQPVSVAQSAQAAVSPSATPANAEPSAAAVAVSTPAAKPAAPFATAEPIKNAAEAVNTLRGLFGR